MKTYRCGASLVPFLVWAMMCSGLVFWLLYRLSGFSEGDRMGLLAVALAGLVFGPMAFLAYLIRWAVVQVSIDTRHGIRRSGGRLIPWEEFESYEFFPGIYRAEDHLFFGLLKSFREDSAREDRESSGLFLHFLGVLVALVLLGLTAILFPAIALLTPWHRRITLHMKNGESIVYRNISDDRDFARELSFRLDRKHA